jgi:hypothetical protein
MTRYPKTHHLYGSKGVRESEQVKLESLPSDHIVVEEKLDGCEVAISFDGALETTDEKAEVLRRIMVRLNTPHEGSVYEPKMVLGTHQVVGEDGTTSIQSGPMMIEGGMDEGYIRERLRQLQTLVSKAVNNDWTIYWG